MPKMGGFSCSSVPRPRSPLSLCRRPLPPFCPPPQAALCDRLSHTLRRTPLRRSIAPQACFRQSLDAIASSSDKHHPYRGLARQQFVHSTGLTPSSTNSPPTFAAADDALQRSFDSNHRSEPRRLCSSSAVAHFESHLYRS